MNVLSLFSGIGGLELGLERAGMTTVGQVEIDPYCRSVLAQHWPEVPRHDDVRTTVGWWGSHPRPRVDLMCGGFPCQPVSVAGAKRAQEDERWLWPDMAVIIRALRPRWVLLENVPGLLSRGAGDVLGGLAAIGYDAEWDCIPASAVGAPHQRDRIFGVAYPQSQRPGQGWPGRPVGDGPHGSGQRAQALADTDSSGRDRRPRIFGQRWWGQPQDSGWWAAEPDVARVAHGVPDRVDRGRALGNAVVPQVAEHIGRLIMAADAGRVAA